MALVDPGTGGVYRPPSPVAAPKPPAPAGTPPQATAPVAKPPAPPSQPSIIPDPAVYEGETAQALQAYNQALANIQARRSTTLQNYGFTAQVDPTTGQMQNYSVDPNNPYGQIQQLLGSEGQNINALYHDAAQRGLGHVGLGAQGEANYRPQMGAEQSALGRAFTGEIGQESSDQLSASNDYNAAKLQAQRDAIASAIQNQLFTPAPQQQAVLSSPALAAYLAGQFTPGTPVSQPSTSTSKAKVLAKSVTANKTGATYVPGRGVISIH